NRTAPQTPLIYTLSLHDALPISANRHRLCRSAVALAGPDRDRPARPAAVAETATPRSKARCIIMPSTARPAATRTASASIETTRSEEHTSELQSLAYLVCRLLLA